VTTMTRSEVVRPRAFSPRLTTATAARVLRQLRHDHRTIAMLLLVPSLLLGLLYLIWKDLPALPGQPGLFDRAGLIMLGIFPFVVMFLITSIAMLRERTSGTLERLLTTPLARLDLLLGYGLAFGVAAALQAVITVGVAVTVYDLDVAGSLWLVGLIAVLDALLGVALGLLASAFARTEFQAVQFMPLIVFPQILLGGIFIPRDQLPDGLRQISDWLPLSHAVDALNAVSTDSHDAAYIGGQLLIIGAFAVAAVVVGALTLQRRTP